jgi:hypothetical protein
MLFWSPSLMPKRKPKEKNRKAEDLPQNPEFKSFMNNLGELLKVSKDELERRDAEEKSRKGN